MKPDYLKLANNFIEKGKAIHMSCRGNVNCIEQTLHDFARFLQSQEAEKGEGMHFFGLFFGVGLYLDSKDEDIIKRATELIEKKLGYKPKTDEELDLEVKEKLHGLTSPLEGLKEIEKLPYDFDTYGLVRSVTNTLNALIENQNKIVSILKQRE